MSVIFLCMYMHHSWMCVTACTYAYVFAICVCVYMWKKNMAVKYKFIYDCHWALMWKVTYGLWMSNICEWHINTCKWIMSTK